MPTNWKLVAGIIGGVAAIGAGVRVYLRASRRISLLDRVVLVAGGSRGLGLVLAREFARAGARVAICARSERELDKVRDEFADEGWPLVALTCDVGVRAEGSSVIEGVRERLIEILVNSAGAAVLH